jgi:ligand-binding sensor domain-containing protein
LHNDEVVAVFEDREGVMWVGTAGGSSRFPTGTLPFKNYQQSKGDPNGLNGSLISSVQSDSEGFLWFGNGRGLIRFDRTTGQEILLQHDSRNIHSLSANTVFAIRQGQPGELRIAPWPQPARPCSQAIRHLPATRDPATVSSDFIISLLLDGQGVLWVGRKERPESLRLKNRRFTRHQYDPLEAEAWSTALKPSRRPPEFLAGDSGGSEPV